MLLVKLKRVLQQGRNRHRANASGYRRQRRCHRFFKNKKGFFLFIAFLLK
jgi:hypothetical protein